MPTTLEILFLTTSVCFFQDRPSSMIKPRKLNDSTRSLVYLYNCYVRFKVLTVPLDFSDANFCPLNSGPLDLNRLKIIDDILNRLKCQNVRWQKHITDEPIRKHLISMP